MGGLVDGIGDLWEGAKHHVGDMWSGIKDNPERAFLGAMTPMGTGLWNSVLGEDWDSKTTLFGGATEKQFQDMEKEGIDTGPKRAVDSIADMIAGFYAGQGLGNVVGDFTGGLGGGGGTSSPSGGGGGIYNNLDTGDFLSQADTGGVSSAGGGFDFMDVMDNLPQNNQRGMQQNQQASPMQQLIEEQRRQDEIFFRQMLASLYS